MAQTNLQAIPQINITGMKLQGYEIRVPQGLSELVNAAGAWGEKQKESAFVMQYDRRVEMKNGKLVTVLTKKIQKEEAV